MEGTAVKKIVQGEILGLEELVLELKVCLFRDS